MAIKKVTDLDPLTSAANDDLVMIVDVSDTSSSPEGTSKKIEVSALQSASGVTSVNTQTGVVVLDADDIDDTSTTNKYTTAADITKLSGIETGAEVNPTASEIKTSYESNADTNAYTDSEKTKLAGVEANADVTDTTNVEAAGALMDSEVTNLAQVKAFDSSDYATAAQGALADSAQQPPTEGAFVDGDKTKLDGIESGAEVNPTASEIKTSYESNADTNAYTDAEKTKLSGIATGAEVNVNADWNAATGDAQILNKPTIPSDPAVENNAGTPVLATGITQAEMQSVLNVDPAGTDNSTDATVGATASDVLKMAAGQSLGAFDAGSDKLVFWDDSDSKLTYATIGTNLTMTGTTLSAAGGGGGGGVTSLNTLSGGLTLSAGSNVTITDNGTNTITIASSGGGGGGGTNNVDLPFAFFDSSIQSVYIPIKGEKENLTPQRYNKYVPAYDGSLVKVTLFGTQNLSGGTGVSVTIRKQSTPNNFVDVETQTSSTMTAYNPTILTFSSNSFVAGDVLTFWIDNGFSSALMNITGSLFFQVN